MNRARRRYALAVATIALLVLAIFFGRFGVNDEPVRDHTGPEPPTAAPEMPSLEPAPDFSETDLRAALETACSASDHGRAARSWADAEKALDGSDFEQFRRELAERLAILPTADHLHAAALLASDPALRLELIERSLAENPDDRFGLWSAVRICSRAPGSFDCPLRDREQRLAAIDGHNSETWVQVAANRYAEGDHDAALAALRQAGAAAESNGYLAETIELMERAMAAGTDLPLPGRAVTAWGLAAGELPRYGSYVTMCREASAQSPDWAYACLAYGELIERQGKIELGVRIGLSIQRLALDALGDETGAAAVQGRLQARQAEWRNLFEGRKPGTERLIFLNRRLFSAYLAAIRSHGEHVAERYLAEEAWRLLEKQPELACAPVWPDSTGQEFPQR